MLRFIMSLPVICDEGAKLYGRHCLEETPWNDFTYTIWNRMLGIVSILLILIIWFVLIKRIFLKKDIKIWKKAFAFLGALILSFIIFFVAEILYIILNVDLL